MEISAVSDPLIPNGLRPRKLGVHFAGTPDAMSRAKNVQVDTRTPDVKPPPTAEPYMAMAAHPPLKNGNPPAIAAMFADWGKADSPHDLNGDGNIGMRDFFDLMKQLSENPERAQVDSLFRDWGRTEPSSPHDLNHDGQVGMRDFFDLMKQISDASRQESAQRPPAPAPAPETTPETNAAAVSVEPVQEPVAQAAQAVEQSQHHDTAPHQGFASGLLNRLHAAYGRAAAENVARTMMPLIAGAEPDELRESIDKARVPYEQRQHVLDRLAAWNPRGMTFNAVG